MVCVASPDVTEPAGIARGFVRSMHPSEMEVVARLLRHLNPNGPTRSRESLEILVWDRADAGLGGFIAFSVRPAARADDLPPVACIESLWVASYLRGGVIERTLLDAAERWSTCRSRTYRCDPETFFSASACDANRAASR